MRYLLDTNIFIFLVNDTHSLSNDVSVILKDYSNTLYLSVESVKEHILTYARLEINEAQGHKDPSDHIIISQAITEKMPLVSSDKKFQFYTKQKLDFINNFK